MLKAVFKVDPTLSDRFYIGISSSDLGLLVNIEFDTGEKDEIMSFFEKLYFPIPKRATKITINSDNDIFSYGGYGYGNPAIISIEEFTSDTIIDCSSMFYGFINLKEIKNINLNWNKIISARNMCSGWRSFNGILPDDFCKNMKSLKDAQCMFSGWKSFNGILPDNFCSNMISLQEANHMFNGWDLFNQKLPDNFCSNMISLRKANHMFYEWKSYNQELPQDFCGNMDSLIWTNYMFCNWNSYEYELPDTFFPDNLYMDNSDFMFWGWFKCDNTPEYYLPEYVHDYKQKDIDELDYLLEKHKEQIEDYQLMSKLTNKTYCLCIKGDIDHYVIIDSENIKFLYDYSFDIYIPEIYNLMVNNDFITIN